MQLPLQHLEKTGSSGLAVRAYFPDGRQQSLEVCEYKGLIIGSGDGCGLRLEFPEVAPLHCLLSLDHNELVVQDWYTKTGTLLNGVRINETKVAPGDEIRIGPCRIVIEARRALPASPLAQPHQDPSADSPRENQNPTTTFPPSADYPTSPAAEPVPSNWGQARGPVAGLDSEKDEMIELLRAEVFELQGELAERDARLAELSAAAESAGSGARNESETDFDTAGLVQRLEELLDELQRRDEREASLEELLRVAEQANSAEQEERRQLAAWVSDVEQRIGERETEWKANVELLQRRIEELTAERDRAVALVTERNSGAANSPAQQQLLVAMQQKVDELRQRLADSEKGRVELAHQVAAAGTADTAAKIQHEVDRTLREERVKLAQERAELANLRARFEFECQGNRGPDEADRRAQVLREHLREIQQREAEEKRNRRDTSLTARLARLWQRLDG